MNKDQIKLDSLVLPKESLSKQEAHSESIKTILIVGNGAIDRGWSPLPEALGAPHIQDPNVLASILAAYTYQYRRLRNELLISIHKKSGDPVAQVENLRTELQILREHRHQVAKAYQTAQMSRNITLRECDVVTDLVQKSENLGVITTNWDSLIWSDNRFKNVIQLHGICSNPDSLIFPSELGTDDNIFELAINLALEGDSEKLKIALREIAGHFRGTEALLLQKAHRLAVTWLKNAQEIMVWGLALHPYDAELLTVIQGTQGPEKTHRLTQVTIINPNESDRDRAGLFLGAPPTLRTDINPNL